MKKISETKPMLAALATLVALALSPATHAQVSFSYEDTVSGHALGSAFAGPFRINLQLFDSGSLYPALGAPGTAAGYGANGTGTQTVPGGVTTLNGLQTAAPTGGQPNEDSWGVGRVLSITDLTGSVVWSETVKNAQITLMFYGLTDFYINQLANGYQEIDGANLHVDWYFQSKLDPLYTQYNPLPGSAGRIDADSYASVTDGAMFMSTLSTPGFIYGPGTLGGVATEFSSVFNVNAGGTGQTYLNVTGGTQANEFNTNFFVSPFLANTTADLFAQFTTVPNDPAVGDWLVRGNDPVTGNFVPIPEPSTYGLIAAGALLGLVAWRRRVQKRAQA